MPRKISKTSDDCRIMNDIYTLHVLEELSQEPVTMEEFSRYDDSCFDATTVEVPAEISNPQSFLELLDSMEYVSSQHCGHANEVDTENSASPSRPKPFRDLMDLVIQAYLDVRDNQSLEYMLVESARNLQFVQRCWQLGALGGPEQFNWLLLNARKSSRLRGVPRPQYFTLPKARFEELSFASELALRYIQDRSFLEQQRRVSLDRLLCSPKLSTNYDALVRRLIPGAKSVEARWTAMTLRKVRKRIRTCDCPTFDDRGRMDDIRVSGLPQSSGIFWLHSDYCSVFVGVAANLRRQVDQVLSTAGPSVVPEWFEPHVSEVPRLTILEMPNGRLVDREKLRSSVLCHHGSRLNFFTGADLFNRKSVG
jgi:hypothetical protein